MNCNQARDLLGASVYDDLDPRVHRDLLRHLGECSACEAERASLLAVKSQLDLAEVPPVDLAPVRTATNPAAPPGTGRGRSLLRRVAAALVLALAGAGAHAVLTPTPETTPDRDESLLAEMNSGFRHLAQRIEALEARHQEDLVTLARVVDKIRGQVRGDLLGEVQQLRNHTERALVSTRTDLQKVVQFVSTKGIDR